MMNFLFEYGLFFAKAVTLVIAILVVVGGILALSLRNKKRADDNEIQIKHLNKDFEAMEKTLKTALMTDDELKLFQKNEQKSEKKRAKESKLEDAPAKPRVFVLDFDGDIKASAVDHIRHEVSAILMAATPQDEVLVRLESGGGLVHGYGLAASQLRRIRDHNIPLTIAVDKVAASGGYMMACVADKIIAAPFAIIGSIGVLMQLPNFHKLLKQNHIDFEQLSAGEYKRTLTFFGENTKQGREKMQQELNETHDLFKQFISSQRPALDIDDVATGEHWLGTRALELGLIDSLITSDEYLMNARDQMDILHVSLHKKPSVIEKLSGILSKTMLKQDKAVRDLQKPMAL